MDFAVNGVAVGGPDVKSQDGRVHVTLNAAARLEDDIESDVATRPADQKPYWDLERARVGQSRDVQVEFLIDGRAAATRTLRADGAIRELSADLELKESGWVAVRILPSSHTNPIWVEVGGKPMRPSRRSAQWCLSAVDKCWLQKNTQFSAADRTAAEAAYDRARAVYRRLLEEGTDK
jgi:hypothetical protein